VKLINQRDQAKLVSIIRHVMKPMKKEELTKLLEAKARKGIERALTGLLMTNQNTEKVRKSLIHLTFFKELIPKDWYQRSWKNGALKTLIFLTPQLIQELWEPAMNLQAKETSGTKSLESAIVNGIEQLTEARRKEIKNLSKGTGLNTW